MPKIPSKFNMPIVKQMGGAAREAARSADRGQLCAKLAAETTATDGAYLDFVHENGAHVGLAGSAGEGHYAFVTKLDGTIVIWPVRGQGDTDHPALGSFSQYVMYAGELRINASNKVSWWNNKSGAYHPNKDLAAQARLPLSKLEAYK